MATKLSPKSGGAGSPKSNDGDDRLYPKKKKLTTEEEFFNKHFGID
jgi:hypothetical protein